MLEELIAEINKEECFVARMAQNSLTLEWTAAVESLGGRMGLDRAMSAHAALQGAFHRCVAARQLRENRNVE